MKIIAHRNETPGCPENSVASLEYSAQPGIYAVECDVRRTGDGQYVIYHDDTLERLTGAGFTRAELEEMGAQVGSDVPYCVAGGTMLAEGRGERLTPVTPMPRLPVVICKPDFPISTPELFRRVDARTSRCRPDTEGICAALADGDMPKLARRMYNVFEDVLTRREGEIAAIKSRLLDGGALGAVMSGTGSAVFGLFADADSAAYAKRRLARDYAECFLTETIDRLEV